MKSTGKEAEYCFEDIDNSEQMDASYLESQQSRYGYELPSVYSECDEKPSIFDSVKSKKQKKETLCKDNENRKSIFFNSGIDDLQYEDQKYKSQLFPELEKESGISITNTDPIDVDADERTERDMDLMEVITKKTSTTDLFNLDLIKREIKREQRLDIQRMARQKQEKKQLLQLQPKRKLSRKHMKKQKIISKKTLQLLAKKFDEFYAFQNNYQYRGPKISLRQIGQLFDIGPNTIHKLYTQWMDDPTFYDRLIRYDLHKRVPQRKLTLQRLQHVARLIKENPFMTQNQICVQLNKIEDLKTIKDGQRQEINKTIVARLLKVGKFKKKRVRCVPKEKNTTKSLEKRFEFCAKFKQLVDKQAKFYFLDQSGFNLYNTRDKAWARPNEQITVNCPISKGKRYSLIATIGQDGLAHWRIIDGTYRTHQYIDFITEMFTKIQEMKEPDDWREKWLIMDNVAIHDKSQTFELANRFNISILFLPAYSPQLNPIEMWFHEVKTKIRKTNYFGERQLLEIMERTLREYEDYDFSNYFHGSMKFVEKGLRKEKF